MLLSKLKKLYDFVDKLPSNVKTLIIIVLLGIGYVFIADYHTMEALKDYTAFSQKEKQMAEQYTQIITPIVDDYINSILLNDNDACNVLLMNYHNTLVSSNGLSYKYFTALTEKRRSSNVKKCIRFWKELEYMDYGDEIEKINMQQYLRIDSIEEACREYPNLCDLLEASDAKAAAFYPITGIEGNIGIVIVLYPQRKDYSLGYYNQIIAPVIQPLAVLLDYNSIQTFFKDTPRNDFIKVFKQKYESRQN